MNMVIDIGNSLVKFGIFKGRKILIFFSFKTEDLKNFEFTEYFKKFEIEKCGICSVVPSLNLVIEEKIKENFKGDVVFIDHKNCGIKINIKKPEKVGIDRIVNCKGASEIFGFPCIVIDIGTATTIDVVDKNKSFIGGYILPGPIIWLESFKKTALIKEIDNKIGKYIGKETSEAINLGLKFGLSGAIEKIVFKIKEKYQIKEVVLTGGFSLKFKKFLNFKVKLRRYLTLEGINLIIDEYGN